MLIKFDNISGSEQLKYKFNEGRRMKTYSFGKIGNFSLSSFFFGLIFILSACAPNKSTSDSSPESNSSQTTEIGENQDGTVTIPAGKEIINCVVNGFNSEVCKLSANKYFYSAKDGGRGPERLTDIEIRGKSSDLIPVGWYPGGTHLNFSDSNLVAGNIKKDVNLFGIVGTLDISRLDACDIGNYPITFGASGCTLSKDLYIYDVLFGGRFNLCSLTNSTILQNGCWVDSAAKIYTSPVMKTVSPQCSNSMENSLTPIPTGGMCWARPSLFVYDSAYGGRSTLCKTDESKNSVSCWAEQINSVSKGFVTSNLFSNWCSWNSQTNSDCRVRINSSNPDDTSSVVNKTAGYVYLQKYGGRDALCLKDNNGLCWLTVEKNILEPNLQPSVIKAGVTIFGIKGKFRGEGSWKSGAHRDSYAYPLAISDETFVYSGIGDKDAGLSDGYREVPMATLDNDGTYAAEITGVDRSGWGDASCGVGAKDANGNSWTTRSRISDCANVFGFNAVWDGTSRGNAGQSKWKLVSRRGQNVGNKGREVWLDENTGLLWSSLVSTNTNWCKASGNNNITGNIAQENDPNDYCDNSLYQNTSGNAVSACYEGTGFTELDPAEEAKSGLSKQSTPTVGWRLPSLYDYEVAEYNGIRFVLPDMGKALAGNSSLFEWTATINNSNKAEAWTFSTKLGNHKFINRGMTAGVRCIGRTNILE